MLLENTSRSGREMQGKLPQTTIKLPKLLSVCCCRTTNDHGRVIVFVQTSFKLHLGLRQIDWLLLGCHRSSDEIWTRKGNRSDLLHVCGVTSWVGLSAIYSRPPQCAPMNFCPAVHLGRLPRNQIPRLEQDPTNSVAHHSSPIADA